MSPDEVTPSTGSEGTEPTANPYNGNDVQKLKAEIARLRTTLKSRDEEIKKLKKEIEKLAEENTKLGEKVTGLTQENQALAEENTKLGEKVTGLTQENQNLVQQNTALGDQLQAEKARADQAEGEVKDLEEAEAVEDKLLAIINEPNPDVRADQLSKLTAEELQKYLQLRSGAVA